MSSQLWEWRTCLVTFVCMGREFQKGQKYCVYCIPPEYQDQSDWKIILSMGSGGGTEVSADLFDPY